MTHCYLWYKINAIIFKANGFVDAERGWEVPKESSLLIWTLKDKSKHQAKDRTFEMCGVGITKALERKQDEGEERE